MNKKPTIRQTKTLSDVCDHITIAVRYHDGHIDAATARHIRDFADLVVRKIGKNPKVRFCYLFNRINEIIKNSESLLTHVDLLLDEAYTKEDVGLKPLMKSASSLNNRIIAEIATEAQQILARPTTWRSETFPDAAPMFDGAIKLLGLLYRGKTPVLDILLGYMAGIMRSDPDGGSAYVIELREYVFKTRMNIRGE